MAIVINGSGTVTGISVGGLPDGIVDAGTLATNSVDSAELIDGAIDASHLASGVGGAVDISGTPAVNQFAAWTDADTVAGRAINGTVSESSGVATGAIVEEGSNSNGKYVKFSGGLLICTKDEIWSAGGSDVTWTYPAAFKSATAPCTAGTNSGLNDTTGERITVHAGGTSKTNTQWLFASFYLHPTANAGAHQSTSIQHLSAIGRWY
jgi:hypothetical protein